MKEELKDLKKENEKLKKEINKKNKEIIELTKTIKDIKNKDKTNINNYKKEKEKEKQMGNHNSTYFYNSEKRNYINEHNDYIELIKVNRTRNENRINNSRNNNRVKTYSFLNKKKIFNGRYTPSNLNKYLGFQYKHDHYKNNNLLNKNYSIKTEPSHRLNTFDSFKTLFDTKDKLHLHNINEKGFRALDLDIISKCGIFIFYFHCSIIDFR